MTPDELRDRIAADVAGRTPVDEREAVSIDRFLAEIARLPEPFLEEADPTHVTASAIVVGPRGLLLHRHKRLGIWLQPGGHIEPGELPWDAAVRETTEETGIPTAHAHGAPFLVHLDVHPGPRGHTHLDLRYLLAPLDDRGAAPGEGESREVEWFSWERALEIDDPGLRGIVAALAKER